MPRQATFHRLAAVVRPDTFFCAMKMVPAPRKPMPLITWADMRPRLRLSSSPWLAAVTLARTRELSSRAMVEAPRHTSTWVRMPAGRFLYSRSSPMTNPMSSENITRMSSSVSVKSLYFKKSIKFMDVILSYFGHHTMEGLSAQRGGHNTT